MPTPHLPPLGKRRDGGQHYLLSLLRCVLVPWLLVGGKGDRRREVAEEETGRRHTDELLKRSAIPSTNSLKLLRGSGTSGGGAFSRLQTALCARYAAPVTTTPVAIFAAKENAWELMVYFALLQERPAVLVRLGREASNLDLDSTWKIGFDQNGFDQKGSEVSPDFSCTLFLSVNLRFVGPPEPTGTQG